MSRPVSSRLLHVTLLVIELALLWLLLSLHLFGTAPITLWQLVGSLVIFIVLCTHLIALALKNFVHRFPLQWHTLAIICSILVPILLVLALTYGMLISMSYLF